MGIINIGDKVMNNYTVFVGGVEVNDYLLSKSDAERLAEEYLADGYDDVQIAQYD